MMQKYVIRSTTIGIAIAIAIAIALASGLFDCKRNGNLDMEKYYAWPLEQNLLPIEITFQCMPKSSTKTNRLIFPVI
jgi:hypothetical protein